MSSGLARPASAVTLSAVPDVIVPPEGPREEKLGGGVMSEEEVEHKSKSLMDEFLHLLDIKVPYSFICLI